MLALAPDHESGATATRCPSDREDAAIDSGLFPATLVADGE